MITGAQIKVIAPNCHAPDDWANTLNSVLPDYQINTQYRICAFIGQCCHESGEFNLLEENLNYSTSGLMKTWPTRFPTDASTIPYIHNPMALANHIYAGRNGNGSEQSGDGWMYRGRGLIGMTFKGTYGALAHALNLPLIEHPEMLLDHKIATQSACEYWKSHALNALADHLDSGDAAFSEITRIINGGLNGISQRLAYYHRAIIANVS